MWAAVVGGSNHPDDSLIWSDLTQIPVLDIDMEEESKKRFLKFAPDRKPLKDWTTLDIKDSVQAMKLLHETYADSVHMPRKGAQHI